MLYELARLAAATVVSDRLVAVHRDFGQVECKGTAELAQRQVDHYKIRLETVTRPQGDLLDHIEARGMFPSTAARYCTSDHKRGQVRKLMTSLTAERRRPDGTTVHADGTIDRLPVRMLNCIGLRSQESPARAKRTPLAPDADASNGRRTVTTWLPILDWTLEQVWERIHATGVEHHWAYDADMPRLSCALQSLRRSGKATRIGTASWLIAGGDRHRPQRILLIAAAGGAAAGAEAQGVDQLGGGDLDGAPGRCGGSCRRSRLAIPARVSGILFGLLLLAVAAQLAHRARDAKTTMAKPT